MDSANQPSLNYILIDSDVITTRTHFRWLSPKSTQLCKRPMAGLQIDIRLTPTSAGCAQGNAACPQPIYAYSVGKVA